MTEIPYFKVMLVVALAGLAVGAVLYWIIPYLLRGPGEIDPPP
jgi:hypothetical protein